MNSEDILVRDFIKSIVNFSDRFYQLEIFTVLSLFFSFCAFVLSAILLYKFTHSGK